MKKSLEIPKVNKFLEEKFKNTIENLQKIEKGEWSTSFSFQSSKKKYVIRFNKSSSDFYKDNFAFLKLGKTVPVPKMVEIGEQFDMYFAITEFLEGKFIDNSTPDEGKKLENEVINLLEKFRITDITDTNGYGNWNELGNGTDKSWEEYLLKVNQPQKHLPHWRENLERSPIGTKDFDEIYHLMSGLIQNYPNVRSIIHGDLLHFNVFFKETKITGVIDWGCAKYGDFLYDLAWFEFWKFYHSGISQIDFEKLALDKYEEVGLEVTRFKERMLICKLHIALDSIVYSAYCNKPDNWNFSNTIIEKTKKLL